jgi:hypothetical protein
MLVQTAIAQLHSIPSPHPWPNSSRSLGQPQRGNDPTALHRKQYKLMEPVIAGSLSSQHAIRPLPFVGQTWHRRLKRVSHHSPIRSSQDTTPVRLSIEPALWVAAAQTGEALAPPAQSTPDGGADHLPGSASPSASASLPRQDLLGRLPDRLARHGRTTGQGNLLPSPSTIPSSPLSGRLPLHPTS